MRLKMLANNMVFKIFFDKRFFKFHKHVISEYFLKKVCRVIAILDRKTIRRLSLFIFLSQTKHASDTRLTETNCLSGQDPVWHSFFLCVLSPVAKCKWSLHHPRRMGIQTLSPCLCVIVCVWIWLSIFLSLYPTCSNCSLVPIGRSLIKLGRCVESWYYLFVLFIKLTPTPILI